MITGKVSPFQLLQWKYAVKLEAKGLRVNRGRKVTPHAARFFGLPPRSKAPLVLEHIEAALDACKAASIPASTVVDLSDGREVAK